MHRTDVVIFDSDTAPEKSSNTTEMFHIIGERFQIERHEYEDLLPKGPVNHLGDPREFFDGTSSPQTSQFAPPRQQATVPSSSAIPAEYQNDPDLWYAI